MWELLWRFFVTFLIIYFVFDSIEKILTYTKQNRDLQKVIIIKVKDCSRDIEGVIRSLVWRSLRVGAGGFIPYIFVVDMGCKDDTMEIVERLSREYSFLIGMTLDEYEQIRRK